MFGNKRNKRDEQLKEIFDRICQKRTAFEISVRQVENGRKRVYKDLCHVMDDANELTTHIMLNIEEEAKSIYEMDEFSKELSFRIKPPSFWRQRART